MSGLYLDFKLSVWGSGFGVQGLGVVDSFWFGLNKVLGVQRGVLTFGLVI